MHQYRISIYEYKSNGSLGGLVMQKYADSPEQARLICEDYDRQKQKDSEGNETNMKAYKVELHLLCYKLCEDKSAFFAQFQA